MTYPGQSFGDPGGGVATRTATVVLDANVNGYSSQMGQAAQQTNMLSQSVDGLVHKMGGLDKWVGRKLFHFAAGDFAMLGAATADAATFEKQLSTLAATSAVTGTSFGALKNGIESAFQKFPVSRGDVIALTEALTNLGVTGAQQISSLTSTFIKLGAATGESSVGLAQGLTQLSRLMGVTDAHQIGNMANSLLTVSKNAGVSASGVLSFAQAIAPMARQAGIGEASVLGISTAFSKAGADGYVAANTFNQIIGDITQLTNSGSPELAKYANLIGVTQAQFKKMDKTTAFTDIFETLAKQGPAAVNTLNNLGVAGGVRAQSALAAVMQSGDLQKQIAIATSAQGNQGNLNKGAAAGMDSLADSLARTRNAFTEFGTVIGTTFLKPLSMVSDVVGRVTRDLSGLMHPVSGLIGAMGAVGGVMAGAGGLAMSMAGTIGTVALINTVRHASVFKAFKAGNSFERDGVAAAGTENRHFQDKFANGDMGLAQRMMFYGGSGVGQLTGPAGPLGGVSGKFNLGMVRNLAITALPRAMDALNAGQAKFLRASTIADPADREAFNNMGPKMTLGQRFARWQKDNEGLTAREAIGRQLQRTVGFAGDVGAAYTTTGASQFGSIATKLWRTTGPALMTSLLGGFVGSMVGVPHAGTVANKARQAYAGQAPENFRQALSFSGNSLKAFGKEIDALLRGNAGSFKMLGVAAKEAAVDLRNLGLSGIGAGVGTGLKYGWRAGAGVVKTGAKVVGSLASAAMTLPGMIAISAGTYGWSKFRQAQDAGKFSDTDFNPIQKYNDMLGTTTQYLANFGQALQNSTSQLPGNQYGDVSSMAAATQINDAVMHNHPNKPVNPAFGDTKGASAAQLAALLATMQITDPKQLRLAEADLAAAGNKQSTIQAAVDQWFKGGQNNAGLGRSQDYREVGLMAAGTEHNWQNQSKRGEHILGMGMTAIDAQRSYDEQNKGAKYAGIKAVAGYLNLLTPMMQGYAHDQYGSQQDSLARTLSKITNGGYGGYDATLRNGSHGTGLTGDVQNFTPAQAQNSLIKTIQSTDAGRKWLAAAGLGGKDGKGKIDASQLNTAMVNALNSGDGSDFNSLLRKSGPLGKFSANNATVQGAIGIDQGQSGMVNKSIDTLAKAATKFSNGSLTGGAAMLNQQLGQIGNTSSPLYQQTLAAQQRLVQQQQFNAPFQTRAQNFRQAVTAYHQAQDSYNKTPVALRTDDQKAYVESTKQGYQQALQSQMSFMQQRFQMAQSYGIQMTRAQEDEQTQEKHSRRDFKIQMANMEEDFDRQQAYAKVDYRTQVQRAEQDFNRQRLRSQQDWDTQMANQAATAAQSIYDPYSRIQTEYTADAGTLMQNMQDQNEAIARQNTELKSLQKRGLSKQAIQTLGLADPKNAQQLDELAGAGGLSAADIRRLNQQARQRVRLTGNLVNNPMSLQFDQGQQAFKRSMDRSQQDFNNTMRHGAEDFGRQMRRSEKAYQTSVDRANKSFDTGMSDMHSAYNRSVKRAGQDLSISMQEVTGNFGDMYAKTMEQIAASVMKFSPKAANQMITDITRVTKQFPWMTQPGSTPQSSDGNPTSTTANTVGLNSKGQVGSYDTGGKWHPYQGYMSVGEAANLPPVAPPAPHKAKPHLSGDKHRGRPGHAMAAGGISTHDQQIRISEGNRSEAVIPLDERGARFMSSFVGAVTREVLQRMHTGNMPGIPSGAPRASHVEISEDHSVNFSGPISVTAQDPGEMARKLAERQRLARLAAPLHR